MAISVNPNPVKPPLGLRPRFIVDRDRALEILDACRRYVEESKPIEDAWWDEFREINDRMAIKYKSDQSIRGIRTCYSNRLDDL